MYDYTTYTEFFLFTENYPLSKNLNTDDTSLTLAIKNFSISSFLFDSTNLNSSLFINNSNWNFELNLNVFLFFKNSSFISFFINNNIDVPTCFKKSKSLTFKTFELPMIKFFNLIMREGKRDSVSRFFLKKILKRFDLWADFPRVQFSDTDYKFFVGSNFFLKNYKNSQKHDSFLKSHFFFDLVYSLSIFEKNFETKKPIFPFFTKFKFFNNQFFFFKNFFLKSFLDVNPIFSYFIYSVDKNVRKYSRGKSGKYVFVWKYIAPYKRLYLAMRLFAKELKFRGERQFYERFLNSIFLLENNFKDSFIYQSKIFSHNYVFKNFKKTLLVSLKTIAK